MKKFMINLFIAIITVILCIAALLVYLRDARSGVSESISVNNSSLCFIGKTESKLRLHLLHVQNTEYSSLRVVVKPLSTSVTSHDLEDSDYIVVEEISGSLECHVRLRNGREATIPGASVSILGLITVSTTSPNEVITEIAKQSIPYKAIISQANTSQ